MTVVDILGGFKQAFAPLPLEITTHVPDSPNVPSVAVYMERWPYDFSQDATFIALCLLGTTDMQAAQAQMMDLMSDTGDLSLVALIDADNTLGGVVSSVLPVEARAWGLMPVQEGRPRLLQGEVVFNVLRNF